MIKRDPAPLINHLYAHLTAQLYSFIILLYTYRTPALPIKERYFYYYKYLFGKDLAALLT